MADPSSSGFVPDDCVSASVTDATADGDTGQTQPDESDRRFVVQRELTFTLRYNLEGTTKPRLIKQFIKWLRK